MIQASILVEGQTEEGFIKEVLRGYLLQTSGVYLKPITLQTKRLANGRKYRGGLSNYAQVKQDVFRLLGDSSVTLVTTFFDLYALPKDFPGQEQAEGLQGEGLALHLEDAFERAIGTPRFKAYIQVHEFEALLFSDPAAFGRMEGGYPPRVVAALSKISEAYDSPEDINQAVHSAPSKRILKAVEGERPYDKVLMGQQLASEIGIDVIRAKCPHFDQWVAQLERLQGS